MHVLSSLTSVQDLPPMDFIPVLHHTIMTQTCAFLLAILAFHGYAKCPLGFVQGPDEGKFNVCYYYINEPLTWFQAEVECNLRKAHLASIKDAGENKFLADSVRSTEVVRQHFWTGGSRGIQGGSAVNWSWINGESFTFAQWAEGKTDGTEKNVIRSAVADFSLLYLCTCIISFSFIII